MSVSVRERRPVSWWSALVSDLFPNHCDSELATARARGWRFDEPAVYCRRCGRSASPAVQTEKGCPACVDRRLPWSRVVRLGRYREPLARWIHELKFESTWTWARVLGLELAERLGEDESPGRTLVCPVPMHVFREWRRGYNQSELIAHAIAERRGWRVVEALRRTRLTRAQSAVAMSQREANVRRTFASRNIDLAGYTVWLVDDVKTSGATLNACARLLRRTGAAVVNLAIIAEAEHGK